MFTLLPIVGQTDGARCKSTVIMKEQRIRSPYVLCLAQSTLSQNRSAHAPTSSSHRKVFRSDIDKCNPTTIAMELQTENRKLDGYLSDEEIASLLLQGQIGISPRNDSLMHV